MNDAISESDRRLIEDWLPIAALGEESVRERQSVAALPPTDYLHVWWAPRQLVASRAPVLAPASAVSDRDRFLHILGIPGDPVASRRRTDLARRKASGSTVTLRPAPLLTVRPEPGMKAARRR